MSDDFRWCVHCGADCELDADLQEHAADCPFSTGVWPMQAEPELEVARWLRWESEIELPDEIRAHVETILKREPLCGECREPINVGQSYCLRDSDTGYIERRPYVGMVVCIGCASVEHKEPGDD